MTHISSRSIATLNAWHYHQQPNLHHKYHQNMTALRYNLQLLKLVPYTGVLICEPIVHIYLVHVICSSGIYTDEQKFYSLPCKYPFVLMNSPTQLIGSQ